MGLLHAGAQQRVPHPGDVTTASYKRPADELARLPLSGCTVALRVDVPVDTKGVDPAAVKVGVTLLTVTVNVSAVEPPSSSAAPPPRRRPTARRA